VAPHWIPSTGLVPVVEAGAMLAPCSIATPSKPIWPALDCPALCAVVDVLAAALPAVLEDLLEPQPTISSEVARSGMRRRFVGTKP